MQLSLRAILVATFMLVFLGACNSSNPPTITPTTNSPVASPSPATSPTTTVTKTDSHGGQGGQVIESGPYHLELVTLKEANSTHIDFFLQKGDAHAPIPDAKVTAQIQLPDGSQKSLEMKYDTEGKHYVAILPGNTAGEYKVAILSDIKGEKVNGRFSFSR